MTSEAGAQAKREQQERQRQNAANQPRPTKKILFPLRKVFLTIGAREVLEESNQTANDFLSHHQSGDWGDICEDDKKENELSLRKGFRILSYKTSKDVKIWIISEACRSSTTILLPSEY